MRGSRQRSSPDPEPDTSAWPGVTAPARRGALRRSLTDVLTDSGFADRDTVANAVERSRATGMAAEQILVESGHLTPQQLSWAIAERNGLDHVDLATFEVDQVAAGLLPLTEAKRYRALPIAFVDERTLYLAVADPANVAALDEIRIVTGRELRTAVASADDILQLIYALGRAGGDDEQSSRLSSLASLTQSRDRSGDEDASAVELVDAIIAEAIERRASDVHFEPQPSGGVGSRPELRVRMRIDGVLRDHTMISPTQARGVISRIKIMSDLDIASHRLPQDGRTAVDVERRQVDVRVVTLPSVFGEAAILRVLDRGSGYLDLDSLGMQPHELERFGRVFRRTHGAILITGPTGSGKSTSLYGTLMRLKTPERSIITIEDPVEYQVPGITQIQVDVRGGLGFADGLRSMMRADPDILMVGEIRDRETAHLSIEGALTGHMVLSTLHTNDAPAAISRLIDMGIESFLVSAAIECVVGQRLVRTLCPECKRAESVSVQALHEAGYTATEAIDGYAPAGCVRCGNTGYRGRVGVFEVMVMNEEIRALTLERASHDRILAAARRDGMRTMREDALDRVHAGVTSLQEVMRVIGSD
jgi:type IV pilus assembly protein PilB